MTIEKACLCACLVQVIAASVSSWLYWLCPEQNMEICSPYPHLQVLTLFLSPLLQCSISLVRGSMNDLLRNKSSINYSLHLKCSWVSILSISHCKYKLLWLELRYPKWQVKTREFRRQFCIICNELLSCVMISLLWPLKGHTLLASYKETKLGWPCIVRS